ncbi:MAG: hypothetical protein ACXWR1_00645 [Bdellovibrionota bacterium]
MSYQSKPKDLGEIRRLFEEFRHWRRWNWSIWGTLGICWAFLLVRLGILLWEWPRASPSAALVLLAVAPLGPLTAAALFQQFVFSRLPAPPLFRVFGMLSSWLVFVGALNIFYSIAGVAGRYHAEPPALANFDEEEMARVRFRADPRNRFVENLDENHRRFVEDTYADLILAYQDQDYARMRQCAAQILNLVDDFKDTRAYYSTARRKLAVQAEIHHRDLMVARAAFLGRQIDSLTDDGESLLRRAAREPRARAELEKLIADIFVKDPNSRQANSWKRALGELDRSRATRGLASVRHKQ